MTSDRVRDWMSSTVETVEPDTGVGVAEQIMKQLGIRRLPVLREGKLVGIVTLGDLREAKPSPATSLAKWEISYLRSRVQVREVMSRSVITLSPETSLHDAAQLMLEHKIGGLPVVQDGELLGIITESDIFRAFVQLLGERAAAV